MADSLRFIRIALMVAIAATDAHAQNKKSAATRPHRQEAPTTFFVDVPAHPFDLILNRPERSSITLSVLTYEDLEGRVVYGTNPDALERALPVETLKKGEPRDLVLNGLRANGQYFYRFEWRHPGAAEFSRSPQYSFHTARSPGSTFILTMTADVHLDEHTSPAVYLRTLKNIRSDQPDFHIDLGNLFMTDKHPTRDEATKQYLAQRYYLGQIGCAAPIFLALGTHDGETGKYDDGSADSLAVWSNLIRKRYFPNPIPDDFYSGNGTAKPFIGLPQNYYSWEWGDAQFVVLDPFSNTRFSRGRHDGWEWTLGVEQYRWLTQSLERSRAKFKFVFIHNLLCGDQAARGGVEVAMFNEWGGKNLDGSDGFKAHRPDWGPPIHQLLIQNHVTGVFRAHDNFYARQILDGIVYLMVPQPSFAGNDRIRDLNNYGYKNGIFLGNSGHVRVSVSAQQSKIEYVRTSVPSATSDKESLPADSYVLPH